MARSHHRRKHKQWQPPPHERKPKKGAASMFAVVGAVVGLGITFFASNRNVIITIIGLLVGGLVGYYFGKNFDEGASRK